MLHQGQQQTVTSLRAQLKEAGGTGMLPSTRVFPLARLRNCLTLLSVQSAMQAADRQSSALQHAQTQLHASHETLAREQDRMTALQSEYEAVTAALSSSRDEVARLKQELNDALSRAHLSEAHASQMQQITEHLQSSVSQQVRLYLPPAVHPLFYDLQERDEVERQVEELRSVSSAKVRAAEAKWEEAMATIERMTERKLNITFTNSSCQTEVQNRLHSSACQTSSDNVKHAREDGVLSGISAIEADYAKKVIFPLDCHILHLLVEYCSRCRLKGLLPAFRKRSKPRTKRALPSSCDRLPAGRLPMSVLL